MLFYTHFSLNGNLIKQFSPSMFDKKKLNPSNNHLTQNEPFVRNTVMSQIQKKNAKEKDANINADQVVQKKDDSSGEVSGKEESTQDETSIQKKEGLGNTRSSPALESKINEKKGKGDSLDESTQREMGSHFGSGVRDVSVHTGEESETMNNQLGSKAFTSGNDIFFNKGEYDPSSKEGQHLLAHELTHTVQQKGDATNSINLKPEDTEPETWNYVVKPGDNLWKLAKRFETSVEKIKKLNGIAEDQDIITIGQSLKIPLKFTTSYALESQGDGTFSATEQKEVIPPDQGYSYETLLKSNFELRESILNYQLQSLESFETIANSPSSKQGVPKGAGAIVVEEITKSVLNMIVDASLKEMPGAGKLKDLTVSIFTAIDAEQKRAQKANEDYLLGQFITNHQERIVQFEAELRNGKHKIIDNQMMIYESKTKSQKEEMRMSENNQNFRYERALGSWLSMEKQFQKLVEAWTLIFNRSIWGGIEFGNGYIKLNVDKNFNVTRGELFAPRGESLAEKLGVFDTNTWEGPVIIRDPSGWYSYKRRTPSEQGKLHSYRPLEGTQMPPEKIAFMKNLQTFGIPKITEPLIGHDS